MWNGSEHIYTYLHVRVLKTINPVIILIWLQSETPKLLTAVCGKFVSRTFNYKLVKLTFLNIRNTQTNVQDDVSVQHTYSLHGRQHFMLWLCGCAIFNINRILKYRTREQKKEHLKLIKMMRLIILNICKVHPVHKLNLQLRGNRICWPSACVENVKLIFSHWLGQLSLSLWDKVQHIKAR